MGTTQLTDHRGCVSVQPVNTWERVCDGHTNGHRVPQLPLRYMQTRESRKRKRQPPTTHGPPPLSSQAVGARKRATPQALCASPYELSVIVQDVDECPDADLDRIWNASPGMLAVPIDGQDRVAPALDAFFTPDALCAHSLEEQASSLPMDALSVSRCTFVSSVSTRTETSTDTSTETAAGTAADAAADAAAAETKVETNAETTPDLLSTRLVICFEVAPIGGEEYSAAALSLCHASHRRRVRNLMSHVFQRALELDATLAGSLLSPRLDACVPHILRDTSQVGLYDAAAVTVVREGSLRIDAMPGTCLLCLLKRDVFRMHGLCEQCWASQRASLSVGRWHQCVMSGLCVHWARIWHGHGDSAAFLVYVWQWVCGVVNVDFCVCMESIS